MKADIVGGPDLDRVVAGWFTPDYRPLAQKFAVNLDEHGERYHLWARPKPDGKSRLEIILAKPLVVLDAMDRYPGKTIVLMDVDCIVKGGLDPLVDVPGDVGVALFGGLPPKETDWRVWLGLSTRVVVFRPTPAARSFVERWAETVNLHGGHEERCAAWAFLSLTADVKFSPIDIAYSGREIYQLPDGVVVHESASSNQKASERHPIMQMLRNFERRFLRSGRSSREKAAMSHIMRPV